MGVLLQGFSKKLPNNAVPCAAEGDASIPWWWDHLASQANALRQVGFTAVWLPPVLKAAQGIDVYLDMVEHQRSGDITPFGGVHLLVGLNNDPNNARTINVATGFGPNVLKPVTDGWTAAAAISVQLQRLETLP